MIYFVVKRALIYVIKVFGFMRGLLPPRPFINSNIFCYIFLQNIKHFNKSSQIILELDKKHTCILESRFVFHYSIAIANLWMISTHIFTLVPLIVDGDPGNIWYDQVCLTKSQMYVINQVSGRGERDHVINTNDCRIIT